VALGQAFLPVLRYPLSVSFHRRSPYSYIIWEMNNRPVGCHSSETVSPNRHKQHEQQINTNKERGRKERTKEILGRISSESLKVRDHEVSENGRVILKKMCEGNMVPRFVLD
jgi:hypothetical protein